MLLSRRAVYALFIVLIAGLLPHCGLAPLPTAWTEAIVPSSACDERLWGHTYFAEERLSTIHSCVVVEGTVAEAHRAPDGDLIIELRTDERLVNSANKRGLLKVEAVCQTMGTQDKHRRACAGYPGPYFEIPRVGQAVRLTGRYVSDRDHGGHMEIHPLSLLERLN